MKVGFARVDVTPPLGSFVAGYFTKRVSDGILDPIELNAIAYHDGENTAVMIATDFVYVMEIPATEIRKLIEKKLGIPAENVFIHGLHSHTSVRVGYRITAPQSDSVRDAEYLDVLYRKFCDVTQLAVADMEEAQAEYAQQETAVPISFIRRYRMKDGSCRTNPGIGNPDVEGPIGEADNTVRLVRFRRAKGDIALVNFSTHPDVIGGTKFSADWPGFIRRFTEKALPGVKCAVFNGAQGDTNHVNVFGDKKTKGYHHSEFMGRTVTDTVLRIWDRTEPCEMGTVHSGVEMVYVPTNTKDMDRMEEYIQLKKDHQEGKVKLIGAELAQISRVCSLPNEKLFQKVPASVLVLGKLGFVGFGGEPFTHYAAAAREAAPKLHVITCCCVNGGEGYLPDGSAYTDGGYEVCNSRCDASVADLLQASAKKMLDAYQEEK